MSAKPNHPAMAPGPLALRAAGIALAIVFLLTAGVARAQNQAQPPAAAPVIEPARALLTAARDGELDDLRRLLDEGVDAGAANPAGRTPLLAASFFGNLTAAQVLIAEGADPAAADGAGRTPLMEAAANGHVEVIRLLVSRGVDVNAKDSVENTALSLAQAGGHAAVVAALEAAGAEATKEN